MPLGEKINHRKNDRYCDRFHADDIPSNLYDFEGYFVAKLIAKSISYNPYVFATNGG